MRLLFLIDHFGSGGAQRQMVNLAVGCSKLGHAVKFLVYHPQFRFFRPIIDSAGIDVIEIRKGGRLGADVLRVLGKELRVGGYDAALAFMETPNIYLEIASILAREIPVVVSERVDPHPGGVSAGRWLAVQMHRLAAKVVANSQTCANMLLEQHPWLESRLTVIRNGVDLHAFPPRGSIPPHEAGRLRLLCSGTITPRKNAHTLIAALADIQRRSGIEVSVVWVGKTESDRYRAELDGAIHSAGLKDRWCWAGEQPDVTSFMPGADVLMHPSLREGLANSVCEALAVGLPALASERGDNRWLIGDDERGVLFDPESAENIGAAILRFASFSEAERAAQAQSAVEFARRELSIERYALNYERVFHELR